jgi:hypothetical protein
MYFAVQFQDVTEERISASKTRTEIHLNSQRNAAFKKKGNTTILRTVFWWPPDSILFAAFASSSKEGCEQSDIWPRLC